MESGRSYHLAHPQGRISGPGRHRIPSSYKVHTLPEYKAQIGVGGLCCLQGAPNVLGATHTLIYEATLVMDTSRTHICRHTIPHVYVANNNIILCNMHRGKAPNTVLRTHVPCTYSSSYRINSRERDSARAPKRATFSGRPASLLQNTFLSLSRETQTKSHTLPTQL